MPTISLCCNFKDEELNAESVLSCVKDIIDEWIVVDSGSTDNTVNICKELGARVYQITHPLLVGGYGGMRTLTAHLSQCDWVLILDGDERILEEDKKKLKALSETDHDLIWLVRQHYRKFDMSIVETRDGILENPTIEQRRQNITVHPDWQPRFFRNKPEITLKRFVHERITGFKNPLSAISNPVIRHFGFLKTESRLQAIASMCELLWKYDTEFRETYEKENEYGHAMVSPAWQAFWERNKDKIKENNEPKSSEWMKDYRKYWK